jgi:DNA-directed RNA polymerase specialized sigma24 family protein
MSDDYQGTITRLLGILKVGDNNAKTKAIDKLWNVYIDRMCEIARNTLTSKGARVSSDHSVIESVFDSLRRRAKSGDLRSISGEEGLWNCLLELINRKAAERDCAATDTNTTETDSGNTQLKSRVEKFATKEPTEQHVLEMLEAIRKIEDGLTKDVLLLHLEGLTIKDISQRVGISSWSVRRKIECVRKHWSAQLPTVTARRRPECAQTLKIYQGAILGYLGVYLRDDHAIATVWQKIIGKWLDGRLHANGPATAFNANLMEILRSEISFYRKSNSKVMDREQNANDFSNDYGDLVENDAKKAFAQALGDELLERALEAMGPGSTGYQVISYLKQQAFLGDRDPNRGGLESVLGNTAEAKSQLVHNARKEYSRNIIEQVSQLLKSRERSAVYNTLTELTLLPYCQKAMDEWA